MNGIVNYDKLSPTQKRMMEVLRDCLGHTREELHACLWDELSDKKAINYHICKIREVLRPQGKDILVEYKRNRIHYRIVQLISPLE